MSDTKDDAGERLAPDSTALSMALGLAGKDESVAAEARVLLREQAELVRLQAKDLRREDRLRHWSLRVRHISDLMKVTFEVTAALLALGLFAIVLGAIWTAAHDDGAVIEAFKVPPDMAQRGLSGDVVASQLLDRLAYMQAHTESVRAPGTYASTFGDNIRMDIPDTGISISEAYRYLAAWLGHQTHISGEVFRSGGGIALTVRTSGHPGARFAGKEASLDGLVKRAAEYIYGQTQPFRYGTYLTEQGRSREADAVLGNLALNGPPSERPWAYANWLYVALSQGDLADALARGREGARLGPDNALAQLNAATVEQMAQHDERAIRYAAAAIAASKGKGRREVVEIAAKITGREATIFDAEEHGDFQAALDGYDELLEEPDFVGSHWSSSYMKSADAARTHDLAASRRFIGGGTDRQAIHLSSVGNGWNLIDVDLPQYRQFAEAGEWMAARADVANVLAMREERAPAMQLVARTSFRPLLALAEASTADLGKARKLIATTPTDCYLCTRVRAQIDALAGNPGGATYWFTRAVAQAPSIPFAYTEWGEMLLHKGDYDGAIAKFAIAHGKGPHFADPLEMWGEALMQENRSDLALAKFAEANNYAPNWGRLHLEWGKALLWSGDRAGARTQFSIASHLDLSAPDAASLSKWMHRDD